MVFLRLTVKVCPRDQTPSTSSFSFRSFLGDRERDDSSRNSSGAAAGKPASFLIVLEHPEDITLGGLAGMIRKKWGKLRPNAEPLEIKKLVDDDHESDDLDADMTVADVFVDNGKARADGLDQRRTVRVIQKTAKGEEPHVRFPSVSQDWDAAAEKFETQRRIAIKKEKHDSELSLHKLETIAEECRRESGSTSPIDTWSETSNRVHRRDIPVSSVEKDDEIPGSPSRPVLESPTRDASRDRPDGSLSTPPDRRMASQELGDSPPSSHAPTPEGKVTAARHGSTQSQTSGNRPVVGDAPTDSPGLQLARESVTHSLSPQKIPPPKETPSEHISLDGDTQSEDEAEESSTSESEESGESSAEDEHDKDGDITMLDEATPKPKQSPVATKEAVKTNEVPMLSSSKAGTQSRKRKNSAEHLEPKKEPRLDRSTPPTTVGKGDRRNSEVSPGTPKFSPSGRRLERASSFSGVARRLSFTERPSEHPRSGLGLGITRSPPKKTPVMIDLSQDSTQSTEAPLQSTPVPSNSAATVRRGSLAQLHTPAEKVKNLHSALRKDSSVERHSERRSVSFAEGDDLLITGSQPVPRSAPKQTAKSSESTPIARPSSSESRRSSAVFPPGYSQEEIDRVEREFEEKIAQRNQERAEFEEKIAAAEQRNANPNYVRKLKDAYESWKSILKFEKSGRQADKRKSENLRNRLNKQQAEIKKLENTMSKASPSGQKIGQSSQKSPNSHGTESETAAATNGGRISPAIQTSGWKAVNGGQTSTVPSGAKSVTPAANGTAPKSTTPKGPASTGTSAFKPQTQKTSKSTSTQSQSSSASNAAPKPTAPKAPASKPKTSKPALQSQNLNIEDDLELPAMDVKARSNGPKKPAPTKEPVDESSSSEISSSEESTSSASSSSSESESESGSESESESESEKESAKITPASKKASSPQKQKSASPSAQRATKSPVLLSHSQPTTSKLQPWQHKPAPASQPSRLSLKGIKRELASQVATKTMPGRANNVPPRKGIFDPPDSSDSDETESESESSSSSDSDSGGESGDEESKKKSQSPVSGDEGDIMSSGQVQKLRTAWVRRIDK